MSTLRHELGAALIAEPMPARPVRPAVVIRCGARTRTKTAESIAYDEDETSAAWYAELRAKQAVR